MLLANNRGYLDNLPWEALTGPVWVGLRSLIFIGAGVILLLEVLVRLLFIFIFIGLGLRNLIGWE